MKYSILYSSIIAATVIGLAACSSGGSDVAGIGGSGITSTGTITGFGSIYVNDIKFETSSSTFDVDDDPDSTEDALALGMRVTVKGTLNADGVSGTATSVTYDEELKGPVSDITIDPMDPDNRTATVLGIDVALNRTTTLFDTSKSGPGNFDIDSIDVGNTVEISGYFDSNGVLVATRIELEDKTFNINDTTVELKGTIANWDGGAQTFKLEGFSSILIDASKGPELEDLSEIADGVVVEVEGTCPDPGTDPICTTIDATRIEGESEGFDSGGDAEIEGIITRYESVSDFDVNGLLVDASSAELEPASLVLDKDLFVEVEGTVVNNVLIATKVELED